MNKKLLLIILLLLFAFSGYSQEKSTNSKTTPPVTFIIVDPGDPGDPGNPAPTTYQWNRDADGDGYGNPASYVFKSTKPTGYVANQSDLDDGDRYITNVAPHTVYIDVDGDKFGNPNVTSYASSTRPGYVNSNGDCNDNDATINPDVQWYRDADGDGYGWGPSVIKSCIQPAGYIRTASDYDDTTKNIINIAPQYFYPDWDRDGFGDPNSKIYYSVKPDGWILDNTDCNDDNASINPNTLWYRDADADGYGYGSSVVKSCIPVAGYVRNNSDIDDTNINITNVTPQVYYYDNDGDGYGNSSITAYYSIKLPNWVLYNNDCNDNDASINPSNYWYYDGDGDGYGLSNTLVSSCTPLVGYVRRNGDYDDTNVNITSGPPIKYYYDADRDSYGDPNVSMYYSYGPLNWTTNNYDCNDSDASLTPYTRWYPDTDGDGYGNINNSTRVCEQPSGYVRNYDDINDNNVNITNITPQYFYPDRDGDGYGNKDSSYAVYYSIKPTGYVTNNEDYSDSTINIINIQPQRFYIDADADGFGNPASSLSLFYSIQPAGYVTLNQATDCDDSNASLNPNTKWYVDDDVDGLGDPAVFVQQCTMPGTKYSLNNLDNCPLVSGSTSDCSIITTPSSDQNYIITKTYKEKTASVIDMPTANQTQINITYFDGLGRPMQQIANKQSSTGKDIITHIGYDNFGRQVEEFLPFVSQGSTMSYEENAKDNTISFYSNDKYENTSNPFSQKQLESSPLSRVLKQAAPGTSWAMGSGHEIKLDYQANSDGEVKLYVATATWDPGLGLYEIAFSDQGNYIENKLYKNITFDENTGVNPGESAGSTVEFKNKEGQVVLKRTYEAGSEHDTYYVYDNYGNLTYVIPPKADGAINDEVLNGLCYQYKYDYRNRLVEKKLPGKQWEFIVYDKLDRPVATGPAFSPFKDDSSVGWIITKYDVFSRPIYTGFSSQSVSSAARKTLQNAQNTSSKLFETKAVLSIDGIATAYDNTIAPTSFKLLTVNYYDDYTFPEAQAVPSTIIGQAVLTNTKGLATGSWTRALTTASSIAGETTTIFYDKKGRAISTYFKNHLTGNNHTDTELDFSGKILNTITEHQRVSGGAKITVKEEFTYSAQDRLLTHTHQINGGVVQLLAANEYDELGQLTSKNVGNNAGSPLQKVDYKYNIRGWLAGINKTDDLQQNTDPVDLFAFKINYDKTQTDIQNVKALYNGNIAETFWKTGSDNLERSYGYKYDKLNRLTDAIYQKSRLTTEAYNEDLSYDKNGNIMMLNRNGDMDPQIGINTIDNLIYTYPSNSNQLLKVVDYGNNSSGFNDANKTGDDYAYDDNGNLISDKNKNITSILYNQLNLPKKIIFGTGNTIEYIYNAAGQKLEKIVTQNNVAVNTNYLGGFQYKDNVLEFFPTAEGYVKNTSGALSYVFQYKDHLGNIRLSYAKNPATQVLEIIEENNYYPFGLKHKGYNEYEATNNKYKYNGKELQDELGLNMYDYGARNYDPALGRWMNIDPHSENYYSLSPYNSFVNNPISFVDPTGEDILFWQMNEKTGKFEQVAFNKLDKNIQKGIEAFGKTKLGYSFLASFANKGDKIGSLSFDKDGKYSNHYMYLNEVEGETGYEGVTKTPTIGKGSIAFQINLNKDIENPSINEAETLGHEVFLHLLQYLDNMVAAYNKGGAGEAFMFDIEKSAANPSGYKDHRALKEDTQGRAKKYFEYISQLKTVLNPNEVQKLVNKDIEKSYKVGVKDTPGKKKK